MAFHRSRLTRLFTLYLCLEFSQVFSQIPTASPGTGPGAALPPVAPPLADPGLALPPVASPLAGPGLALPPVASPLTGPELALPPAASPLTGPGLPPVARQAPVSAEPVPAPTGALQPQPQVTNLIEALRDAGRFGAIAGLLDGLQMKSLTPMTTWLLPNDQAFSGVNYPKNVTKFLDYHVIRELLPYSRLLTLNVGIRLPTFLGPETCVVTNNNQFNFSIDNAMVVVPDLYSDSTIAVHGIDAVLDEARFNGIAAPPSSSPVSTPSPVPSLIPCAAASVWGPLCSGAQSPGTGLNITFPNAARGLYTAIGVYMTVASASILAATVLL